MDFLLMAGFNKYIALVIGVLCLRAQITTAQQKTNAAKTLDFFIERATATSPLLKDYSNQLLMTSIDSLRLKASYGLQVIGSSTGMYAPIVKGYGFDDVITNGQALDALLSANYAITGKGLKANQLQAIRLQRDSITYATSLSKLDLRKTISEQYIAAYASQQQVNFNREIFSLLNKEDQVLKTLTRANAYKQTEYLTFLVTFKQQQLQFKQAELQFKNDLLTLNYLSGIADTATVELAEPMLRDSNLIACERSFFTKRFELDSLKAENDRKAIDLSYQPKASVYVNGGYNSSLTLQPYKNFGTSVGFTIALPLYDGHQRKMQYDRVNLRAQTTTAYRQFFSRQQQQQLNLLKQQISATDATFQQINDQIKLTKGLIDVDAKLLRTGDVKIADFVIAINNYLAAQNLYRQTNINRLKLISQLNYWNR
ncbi:TolC family protein [Pedobacter sp. PWIIR3]